MYRRNALGLRQVDQYTFDIATLPSAQRQKFGRCIVRSIKSDFAEDSQRDYAISISCTSEVAVSTLEKQADDSGNSIDQKASTLHPMCQCQVRMKRPRARAICSI